MKLGFVLLLECIKSTKCCFFFSLLAVLPVVLTVVLTEC